MTKAQREWTSRLARDVARGGIASFSDLTRAAQVATQSTQEFGEACENYSHRFKEEDNA